MAAASQTDVATVASGSPLLVRRLEMLPDAERAFVHIYGGSRSAFWLDSSAIGERGRFSFMGNSEGPLGALVTHDVGAGRVRVEGRDGIAHRDESIFELLARAIPAERERDDDLPFDFDCGFVGYLGYELKAECDGAAAHRAATPDAALILADRLIAFDHEERCAYLLALLDPPSELHQILGLAGREFDAVRVGAERWIEETGQRLAELPSLDEPEVSVEPGALRLRRSPQRYREDIAACKRYLEAGNSYEICLTNKVVGEVGGDPLDLYRSLRRVNPAPFAAFLRFGDLAVLSSSPERFLAVDRERWAEARPIKGTAPRGADAGEDASLARWLCADPKSRAENVTIVDLLRNDLGAVCEYGTVEVFDLMRVESYETVHHLVSSVGGRLRDGVGAADCVRSCFPPGSMTGAPKRRTMEIIDELEGEARGVYSGAIGYLGLGGGCDLSVAIRTIVLANGEASIGAGGAIVADSDPTAELEEMLLKARAPMGRLALQPHF
jgi:para-aminobenzoate synthetase